MKYPNDALTVLKDGTETDIMPQELKIIEQYKELGLPGIASLSDQKLAKCLDLYLSGKTYLEISRTLNVKKEIVLYLAQKFDWYGTKMEHMQILDFTMKERILQAKLVNQDFLLQIQHFFKQKIGNKMTKFMATDDDETASKVDKKDIEMYFKSVDLLDKISTDREKIAASSRGPSVGLNLGDGVSVKKIGEDEVLITPRNKTVAEMLKEMADMKRKEEVVNKANDISNKTSNKKQEEEDEENED